MVARRVSEFFKKKIIIIYKQNENSCSSISSSKYSFLRKKINYKIVNLFY